jgi:hypothetical protein
MGPLETKLRQTLGEVADNELLDELVEKVLGDHCEVYALWSMNQMIAAQGDASDMATKRVNTTFQFHQGRIAAYQDIFARVAFDGRSVEDGTLTNKELQTAIDFWREEVEKLLRSIIPETGA